MAGAEKCAICGEEIEEENDKLKGTILKVLENKKKNFIYVCSSCMKSEPKKYVEKAEVRAT